MGPPGGEWVTPAAYFKLDSNDLKGKEVERQKKKHRGRRKSGGGGRTDIQVGKGKRLKGEGE